MESQFDHWGISDHQRISGIDGKNDDLFDHMRGGVPPNMNEGELGCVLTHLNAVRFFVESTDLDEVLIMEDDLDMSTAEYWNFAWKDVRSRLPVNWDTCQFTIINPVGIRPRLHHRFINDWSAACYLISRHHASKILSIHGTERAWQIDQGVRPRAVSEDLILDSGKSYALPLFSYRLDLGSSVHEEHIDLYHRGSSNAINDFWKKHGSSQDVDSIMDLDEYVGRLPPEAYMQAQSPQEADSGQGPVDSSKT